MRPKARPRGRAAYPEKSLAFLLNAPCALSKFVLNARHHTLYSTRTASWRSGDAEDCKSLHPSSILGEASTFPLPDYERTVRNPFIPGAENRA